MAVQDYKINYKSDFVLTINGDAGWATQFCIKFWTGMPSQAYFVGFDGVKYINCRVGDTPTQLLVMFDDHHLPIGKLMMQIAYHTTIEEFPGSVFDEVTNARDVIVTIDGTDYQVMLDFTGEDAPELEFDLPAYANEAERIQNELQRQQNEADRIAAELQREQATAAAVQGAENVNAQLNGTTLTVTNRQGVSTSVNTKGEQGVPGPVGPEGPQGEQGPKGEKGDTGATGPQGIQGPAGPQGQTGVSITDFVKTGETETDTLYDIEFSDDTTKSVAIPKGEKGDQGEQGPEGPQGPMGDVAVITPEQQAAFTMYSTTGQNTDGPMTQKAVTDALRNIAASGVSYDSSQSGTPANNVQDCIDILSNATRVRTENVNISNLPSIKFCINVRQAKWFIGNINTGAFTKHILVSPSEICRVTTTTINRTRIFFLANYEPQNGASVTFIYKAQEANTTIDYVVPEGIHYILFQDETKLGNDVEIPSSIVKLDAVTDYMQEVQNEVVNINTAIYSTTDMFMSNGASEKSYYTYSNGVISRLSSPSTFRSWNVNVLSKSLYALKIKFYLPAESDAKTFFTNDNDVKVGDFLSNETGDYVTYIIPEGATKLYWTVNYSTQTDIGMVGVVRNSFWAEKSSYNNSSAILSSNNVQGALSDIGNSIFELNQTRISAGQSTQQYFTYNNGVITKVSNSSFRCWNPIDITPYYAVSLKFYLPNSYAKSFFTDENNVMVGDFLTNTTGGYVNYVIPQGAKKLYWSADYNTQTDVSVYGLTRTKKDKEISILFIGNSLTQDAVSYTPLLLRELAPDIDFKFYMWYNGGYNLAQQLADFNNNVACDIFSVCESSGRWTNTNESVTMQSVLSTYRFDVVCLQEYFNYQESANIEAFNGIIEYIENNYYHPFKVVTLFHQPKRDIAATVFDRTKTGNALILKDTVAEDMIPSGIAIYRALSTSLDSLGDQGHLSPDGTHAQEGLPCMMQAYVTAMWVMKQVGTQMSVNNASTIVDNNNYNSINVPGPNLGTGIVIGTTEQVRLSQKVAIQAFKEGEYFVNANLTEYTT